MMLKKLLKQICQFHNNFLKDYRKLRATLRLKTDQRLVLFRKVPFHPLLNNHGLRGKYTGYRSINITGDYRAIYIERDNLVIFMLIGTHSELY